MYKRLLYVIGGVMVTTNVYMYLERTDAYLERAKVERANTLLKQENDSLRSDYIKKVAYKQTIDSFIKVSLIQLMETEELKINMFKDYHRKQDSLLKNNNREQ